MKPKITSGQTLEISKIVLPMKPVILRKFDSLREGESMVIANEHNPYILYYQLLEERGNIFTWEYLENGPKKWRVKITKQQEDFPEPTVGEMAALDYTKVQVFQHFGISFCCSGEKSLKEACEEAGISEESLEDYILKNTRNKAKEVYDFERWEPDFLADYIINTHHSYLKENMGMVYGMALNQVEQHDPENPDLKELVSHLNYFFAGLSDHMQQEEEAFFPLIRKMALAKKKYRRALSPFKSPVGETVGKMIKEHKQIGESLKFIRKLTHNYRQPIDFSSSDTILYAKLIEFENDLVQHIHLENNILFPKVVALERELLTQRL